MFRSSQCGEKDNRKERVMNQIELARVMLSWEDAQSEADTLKKIIEREVKALGETFTVGNIVATYRNPRKSYDYRGALEAIGCGEGHERLKEYTTHVEAYDSIDWTAAAKGILVDIPYTEGEASVSLRVK